MRCYRAVEVMGRCGSSLAEYLLADVTRGASRAAEYMTTTTRTLDRTRPGSTAPNEELRKLVERTQPSADNGRLRQYHCSPPVLRQSPTERTDGQAKALHDDVVRSFAGCIPVKTIVGIEHGQPDAALFDTIDGRLL